MSAGWYCSTSNSCNGQSISALQRMTAPSSPPPAIELTLRLLVNSHFFQALSRAQFLAALVLIALAKGEQAATRGMILVQEMEIAFQFHKFIFSAILDRARGFSVIAILALLLKSTTTLTHRCLGGGNRRAGGEQKFEVRAEDWILHASTEGASCIVLLCMDCRTDSGST